MHKRIISILLIVAILSAFVVFPTNAESVPVLTLKTITFTDKTDAAGITAGSEQTTFSAGDYLAVELVMTNPTTTYVQAITTAFNCSQTIFSAYSYSWENEDEDGTTGPYVPGTNAGENTGNLTDNVAYIAGANSNGIKVTANTEKVLGYFLLKIADDAETCDYKFQILNDGNNDINGSAASKGTDDTKYAFDYSNIATTIHINGVSPTLKTASLDASSVNVDGSSATPATVKATATSKGGTDISSSVAWSIWNGESEVADPSTVGLTVGSDGTITIANNAKAGTYTIKAKADGTNVLYESGKQYIAATDTLTITRAAETVASVSVEGGQESIAVPADEAESNATTTAFTATVKNQYGETYAGTESVSWTVVKKEAAVVDGITIADGVVTVAKNNNTVKTTIPSTENVAFTVTATCGGQSDSAEINIKRAESKATYVEISGGQASAEIPADAAVSDLSLTAYTATVKDQYHAEMKDEGVNWKVTKGTSTVNGVTISEGGVVTVKKADSTVKEAVPSTNGVAFTVTATSTSVASVSATTNLTLARAADAATAVKIYKDGTLAADSDVVIIPQSSQNEYTYTGKLFNQYDTEMSGDVIISVEGDSGSLTDKFSAINERKAGKITLTNSDSSYKDKSLTLKGTYGSVTKEITVTAKDIEFKLDSATGTAATASNTLNITNNQKYGTTWADIASMKEVSLYAVVGANNTAIDAGALKLVYGDANTEIVSTDKPAAETYTVKLLFTGSVNSVQYENIVVASASVTVDKADLTPVVEITGWTYDGTAKNTPSVTTASNPESATPTYKYYTNEDCTAGETATEPKNAGDYWVKATIAEGTNYKEGTSAAVKFTIAKADLTPVVEITGWTYDGTAKNTPSVTDASNPEHATPTYKYYTNAACTTGETATEPTNAGDYWVKATIAEGTNYKAGTSAAVKFTIAKKAITIVMDNQTKDYKADLPTYTWQLAGGSTWATGDSASSITVTPSCSAVKGSDVGKYDITGTATAANYTVTVTKGELTINQIVAPTIENKTVDIYKDATTAATYNISSLGLTEANGWKDAKFTNVASVDVTAGVITNISVNGTNPALIDYTPAGGKGAEKSNSYTVTVSSKNYLNQTFTLTFHTVNISITWPKLEEDGFTAKESPVYGDTYGDLLSGYPETTTATANGPINGTFSVKNADEYPNAGETTVTLVFTPNEGEAITGTFEQQYTITAVAQKEVEVEWTHTDDLVYNGFAQTPTASFKAGAIVNDDAVEFTVSGGKTDAGTGYTATATVSKKDGAESDKSGNYSIKTGFNTTTFSIAKKPITLTSATDKKTYDGNALKNEAVTDTNGSYISGEALTYTFTGTQTNAGSSQNTFTCATSGTANIDNYDIKYVYGTLTVEKKDISEVTIAPIADVTFNGSKQEPTLTVTDGSPTIIKAADYTVSYSNNTNAGTANATITATSTGNYKGTKSTTFTILQKSITDRSITVATVTDKTYTGSEIKPALTITDSETGKTLMAGTDYTVTYSNNENVGTASFFPAGAGNYTGSTTGTFNIIQKTLTVGPASYSIVVGKDLPDFALQYSGLVSGDEVTVSPNPTLTCEADGKKVGSYDIIWAGYATAALIGADAGNYKLETFEKGTLTVQSGFEVPKTRTLTFETNGGKTMLPEEYALGEVVDLTKITPTKAGYTFGGWYLDEALTVPVTEVTMSKHTTVYAKWVTTVTPFLDVQKGSYCYDAVMWAVQEGVTSGKTAEYFDPSGDCTRAQFVTFLWRAAGSPAPQKVKNTFTDVGSNKYYYAAVLWAIENGITKGTTATTFEPDAIVSRGQVVTFLYRYAKAANTSAKNPFTDVSDSSPYFNAIIWASENGITKGLTATTFGPKETCTRGQVVTFLYRFFQL